MDSEVEQALEKDRLIDITTIGRKSGDPHRVEIGFFYDEEGLYITGRPGRKRDWLANMTANPDFTWHFKETVQAGLPAHATPITEETARREVFTRILKRWKRETDMDAWVEKSPLVEVRLDS